MWEFVDADKMVEAPGTSDVPICTPEEMVTGYVSKKNDYYSWPCPRV